MTIKKLLLILALATAPFAYADPPDTGVQTNYSTAYEASHIMKMGPGQLVSLLGYNSKASAQFIQVFDATAVPADGAAPDYLLLEIYPVSD